MTTTVILNEAENGAHQCPRLPTESRELVTFFSQESHGQEFPCYCHFQQMGELGTSVLWA